MRFATFVFAILCTVIVSVGFTHHVSKVTGPNGGPTPTCPRRMCGK